MNPEEFVHLHLHSHYSLLEALPKPKALVERVKSQGMKALALTDNGAMYGMVEFFTACKENEIKPIIGLDAYLAPNRMTDKRPRIDDKPYRLTLIALNEVGYKNLLKISSTAYIEGFYYKPRTDKVFLREHAEGIVMLTGGLNGEIPKALSVGDSEKAKKLLEEYQGIFGNENVYLELIHHPDMPSQVDMNESLRRLAAETGAQMVVTKNAFYLDPDDREGYEAQLCIQRGSTLEEFRQRNAEDVDLSIGTPQEILEYFKDVPEALENTRRIAERVNFEMDLGHNYLPIFPTPEGKSEDEYLHDLAVAGMHDRYGENPSQEVIDRLEFEYSIIQKMGFASYFIIVQDFVNYAKDNGILVGPGRGSAAGSIIAYCLKITDLDPLRYGLLFERFLNPDRISMPDIDMDFADNRRGEVLDYVTNKYGADRVAGIITFGTLMPRAAVRDAARVLGLTFAEADLIAKAVPPPVQGRHTPLVKAIEEHPELRELYRTNPMTKRVIDLAMKLEGNPRHASQHACGIVIGDRPLVERVPIQAGQREDMALVTQYSLNSAEAAGLVKMDFLGLSNLTIIQDALDIIEAVHKVKIDINTVPLDDQPTFDLLGRGETTGVFQLESEGMKRYIRDLKPSVFEDIVAMVSLYRPGPLSAGMVPQYINRKHGRERVVYDHPLMEDILKETYGVTVYQEQIMKISRALAGFTAGQADTLRKAMGKKKRDVLEKMFEDFSNGCKKNGVSETVAKKIWTDWEGFADYAFNKSHAACYAKIAYQTAYLKAHYPAEFMAALMNSDIDLIDRITIEVEECNRMGLQVLPPDVNESFAGFATVPGTKNVRWGLHGIKNVGTEIAKEIVAERKKAGPFQDLADFVSRINSQHFNKKSLESLIKAGALDRFEDRSLLIGNMDQLLLYNKQIQRDKQQSQITMFDFAPAMTEKKICLRKTAPISNTQMLSWEKELLGIYVSSHPMRACKETIGPYVQECGSIHGKDDGTAVKVIGVISDVKKILTKKKQEPMAFVRVEDWSGPVEVVVFPQLFKSVKNWLENDRFVAIAGTVSEREREENKDYSILADKMLEFREEDISSLEQMFAQQLWYEDGFKEAQDTVMAAIAPQEKGVSIMVPERPTHEMITQLRDVFKEYPGNEKVYLVVRSGDRDRRVATEYSIKKSPDVLGKIGAIVGEGNVLV